MSVIKPVLHHVTMKTSRLAEMIAWYAAVVGASVSFRDETAAWMTNDAANHRIAFLAVPGLSDDPQKISHNGMHHSAFEYASFSDLMSSYKRLQNEDIHPAFCLDHGLTASLYYRDPEGNFVELQSDDAHVARFRRQPHWRFFRPGEGLPSAPVRHRAQKTAEGDAGRRVPTRSQARHRAAHVSVWMMLMTPRLPRLAHRA
jgi:catechol 2,3-dioxygenase-like lactoylglutathione lyase family enzyme